MVPVSRVAEGPSLTSTTSLLCPIYAQDSHGQRGGLTCPRSHSYKGTIQESDWLWFIPEVSLYHVRRGWCRQRRVRVDLSRGTVMEVAQNARWHAVRAGTSPQTRRAGGPAPGVEELREALVGAAGGPTMVITVGAGRRGCWLPQEALRSRTGQPQGRGRPAQGCLG